MKIVDIFLYAEPHEADLLWLKLSLEDKLIHEWVICESDYTIQGEYKGFFAKKIIANEDRFAPFRDRITVLHGDFKPEAIYNREGVFDRIAYKAEFAQRELARDYVTEKYADDDYVLISDVDEMLDGTCDGKVRLLFRKIKEDGTGLIQIPRKRFWFDYDNLWAMIRSTPILSVRRLKQSSEPIGDIRNKNLGPVREWNKQLVFEYSFCFSKEDILRKYRTTPHTGYREDEIEIAMKCNHKPLSKVRRRGGQVKMNLNPDLWFEKVDLNSDNSPKLVRENLPKLKTGVISEDYEKNREQYYPNLFPSTPRLKWYVQLKRNFLLSQYKLSVRFPRLRPLTCRLERM